MSSIDKINVGGVDFDIKSSPTPVMAPVETSTTATQAYAVGDYVIVGSTLHEVTAAIAIDDTFTEGTNISTSTNFGNEIKEVKDDLTDNLGGTSDTFKFATDGNGNYGYVKKVSGADTFFPFKYIKKIGTYSNNATINISNYGATNISQFLLVPKGVVSNSNSGYVGNVPTTTKIEYVNGSLSLNGNNLTITLPQIKNTLSGNAAHVFNTLMICDLYYIS